MARATMPRKKHDVRRRPTTMIVWFLGYFHNCMVLYGIYLIKSSVIKGPPQQVLAASEYI
jgi:hypothetical protein